MSNEDLGRSALIKVSRMWLAAALGVVGVPFLIVWGLASWNLAIEILTGTAIPFQPGIGPFGCILALAAYLLVPAAVAAIVASWLTAHIRRVYGDSLIDDAIDRVRREFEKGPLPPGADDHG